MIARHGREDIEDILEFSGRGQDRRLPNLGVDELHSEIPFVSGQFETSGPSHV